MFLHLLLFSRHFGNITQTSLIRLQCVFCVLSVSDDNVDALQPEIRHTYTLPKARQHLEVRQVSQCPGASLVQVDGGQAVDVVHLLQCDVQFGAQYRGGAGLLRRSQDLLSLLCDGGQFFL